MSNNLEPWIYSKPILEEKLDNIKRDLSNEIDQQKRRNKRSKKYEDKKKSLKYIDDLYKSADLYTFAKMYIRSTKYDNNTHSSLEGATLYAYVNYIDKKEIAIKDVEFIHHKLAILFHNSDVAISVNELIEKFDKDNAFDTYLQNILDKNNYK